MPGAGVQSPADRPLSLRRMSQIPVPRHHKLTECVSSPSVSGDKRLFIYFGTVRGGIRVLVLLPGDRK